MIEKEKFHPLNYIKKEEYSGSMDGMRYMLKKVTVEEVARLQVTIWPEPLGIHATPDELKTVEFFDLDDDGVSDAADWLNKQYFDRLDEWKAALDAGLVAKK